MKKILIVCFLVVGLVFSASAVEMNFGFKVGGSLNMVSLDGNGWVGMESGMAVGFQVGALMEVKFSKEFSLQPELLFVAGRAKLESSADSTSYFEIKENMIELPVLLKYSIALQNEKFLSFFAGPSFAFGLGTAQSRMTLSGTTGDWEDVGSDYPTGNMSVIAGASFELNNIILDLRYNLGLKDKDDSSDSYKYNSIVFSVGYKI